MHETDRRTGKAIRDMLLVGGLLAALNAAFARQDPGWLGLNPTPWLLFPLLLGARYGIGPGFIAGFLAAGGTSFLQGHTGHVTPQDLSQRYPWFFTSLLLAGYLAGEIHRFVRARQDRLAKDGARLSGQVTRLEAELELARETRQQLQRHLALLNAPLASLDDDLRKLLILPAAQMLDGLLALLHQHTGIISAGLYRQDGTRLQRLAALHPGRPLAETLTSAQVPLATRAMDERSIASVASAMETTEAQPFLAAIPWEGSDGHGLLLVQDMPLETFDWGHLAAIHLIMSWAFVLSRHRDQWQQAGVDAGLIDTEEFRMLVGQALEAARVHHLPSVLLRADFLNPPEAASSRTAPQLLKALPALALCTRLPNSGSLLVLLPFGGETEGQESGQTLLQAGASLRVSQFLVSGPATLDELWGHASAPSA